MGLLNQSQYSYYNGTNHGNYQFTSLTDIINQFMVVYVGEDKMIRNASRTDVAFHAQRALAELSFDTLKSCKGQEITVPASLQMILPQDYVNYTKISWVDSAGIKHLIYPTSKTSNPSNLYQNSVGEFKYSVNATFAEFADYLILDDEYPSILPGMQIISPYVPNTANVVYRTHTNATATATTVYLADQDYPVPLVPFVSGFTGTIPIEIITPDNNLLPLNFNSINSSAFGVTLTAGSPTMVVSAAEAANIEVGMFIYLDGTVAAQNIYDIPTTTTVLAINGNNITMSSISLASTGIFFLGANFISPDVIDSDTWSSYQSATPSENQDDYQDDTYWPMEGSRYGLDPQHAQANGSFYIDCVSGKIHFSSNLAGKTVILDYISDSLGTDGEMQVHKFAEEAMYKWMSHAILSGKANIPEYQVNRLKKERFAAIRTAKLRLSSLKLEELTQILRGKSKQIKH